MAKVQGKTNSKRGPKRTATKRTAAKRTVAPKSDTSVPEASRPFAVERRDRTTGVITTEHVRGDSRETVFAAAVEKHGGTHDVHVE